MTTKAQEALEALRKIEMLKEEAVAELLSERSKIEEQLIQLGHIEQKHRKAKKKAQGKAVPDKECSLCKFVTIPPHDGRQHRSQNPKGPFTAKQLEELGLKKRA